MDGQGLVRHCFACRRNVYDLASMEEDEAEGFVSLYLDDDPSVRLYVRPDGRFLTAECEGGARRRHQRRVAGVAALAVCGLSAVTAAAGDLRIHRSRPLPRHSRVEVPRAPAEIASPASTTLELGWAPEWTPPPPVQLAPWGRDDDAADPLRQRSPILRSGGATVSNAYPPEVVARIVRQSFGRFRLCYERGLLRDASIEGRVVVRFVIDDDGAVSAATGVESTLPDDVSRCVVESFGRIAFPRPERGRPTVTYTLRMSNA